MLSIRKIFFVIFDIVLALYIVMAVTSFNKPDETGAKCVKVAIDISDSNNSGFLSAGEIKRILERKRLYPLNKTMSSIVPRQIEEALKASPFVNTAECYKTNNGHVCISITQRSPIIRIKSDNGADYYLDDQGGQLPNSHYTSDLIIATGHISNLFAQRYIAPLARTIMTSELWNNQIVQINVLPDLGIELVPRVGNHIVFMGYLPQSRYRLEREKAIEEFTNKKLTRLEKFYRYGLSNAGWNKYSYINIEFDNQIICKKNTII